MDINEIPLRERKAAKTKLAIMRSFMHQLQTLRFEDISIQEICNEVEISEGTFFNYFPKKFDVLHYALSVASLARNWRVTKVSKSKTVYEDVSLFYEILCEQFENAHVVYELIGAFVREVKDECIAVELSLAEKLLAYPEHAGIEECEASAPELFFSELVEKAIKKGELPKETNVRSSVIALKSIVCGVTLAVKEDEFSDTCKYMKQQLQFIWDGLGGKR